MSRGLGRIEQESLEHLRQQFGQGDGGWCFVMDVVYALFRDECQRFRPTRSHYVSTMRALTSLERRGMVEKRIGTNYYHGKRRGRNVWIACCQNNSLILQERLEGSGFGKVLYVRVKC